MDLTFLALQAEQTAAPVLPGGNPRTFLFIAAIYLMLILAGMVLAFYLCDRLRSGRLSWEERLTRLKNRPWQWREAGFLALFLGMAEAMVAWLMMISAHIKSAVFNLLNAAGLPSSWIGFDASDWLLLLVQILFFHVLGLAAIVIMVRGKRCDAFGVFGAGQPGLLRQAGAGAVFYLASLPFVLFGAIVYNVVLYRFGVKPEPQGLLELLLAAPAGVRVVLVLSAFLIAPIFEEALFRGIGLPLFIRRFGGGAAIVMVSALFAGLHFHLSSFLPLFILAIAFSLAYVYTGSLVVPVVMHALFNGVNLGLVMLVAAGGK